MRFSAEVIGVPALIAELQNIADKVPDSARKTMNRGADKIVEEAKLNTPVDTHGLEDSIRAVRSYTGSRRRLEITIQVGGTINDNGEDTSSYAVRIHENYEGIEGAPGPGTIAKRNANPGRYIGSKFLERAVESVREKLTRDLIAAVVKEVNDAA